MRKVILTVLLGAALVSAASCSGGVSNATSFVDYDFSEYTLPPTEKITEAPSEKTTQKSSTSASEKTTAKATSKPTEKATKKPKPTEVVINRKQEATSETSTKAEEYTPPVVDDYTDEPVYVPTEPPTHAPTQPPVTITADDIKITYNNYPLTLDCDFRAVAGGFGEPDEKSENRRSTLADNGEAYTYKFGNMTVNTYVKDGVERVETVRVEGQGKASTSKGVTVGNPMSYIIQQYGKPLSQDTVILKYKVNSQFLIFYLESNGGAVSGFSIVREI